MSQTDIDTLFHPEIKRRPAWQKRLPWIVGVVVVGLLIAGGIIWSNTGTPTSTPLTNLPAQDNSKVPNTVKLQPGAEAVARTFIRTAVARKNLAHAYNLVTDEIKQGQSLKSWETGNIAVVPYPAYAIKYAPMKIDFSYPREAMIEIALLPKKNSGAKPALFIMDLVKRDGHWLVNSWVPRSAPPVPNSSGSG